MPPYLARLAEIILASHAIATPRSQERSRHVGQQLEGDELLASIVLEGHGIRSPSICDHVSFPNLVYLVDPVMQGAERAFLT
ncbi:hypothetical protein NM688_g7154 [Phlebia brevispora]|uniref:Uncharacterized protein n=1 Tax=Phlebia brevispora TaxID=194682 RepID=A0ACC1S8L1_9APHY|nr:hypothetical protein NM688_g7154 [Phlebia brevispora]